MGSVGHQRSCISSIPRFTVGRDHHGWWVVHDREERVGGLFRSCEAALRFAGAECEFHRDDIHLAEAGEVVELGSFTADSLPLPHYAHKQFRLM